MRHNILRAAVLCLGAIVVQGAFMDDIIGEAAEYAAEGNAEVFLASESRPLTVPRSSTSRRR